MHDGLAEHVPHVYRWALRLTRDRHRAEDLAQETFLRAYQRSDQLKNTQAVRVWLLRIAFNLMRDDFRSSKSRPVMIPLSNEPRGTEMTPDLAAESKEEVTLALELLDSLPPQQRSVLYLSSVEELTLDQICEILKINKNTAKANLSIARKRMREELAKRISDPRPHDR